MSNFTNNHRATSVGNQLLQNYRKFLAAYEEWHQHDINPVQAAASFEVHVLTGFDWGQRPFYMLTSQLHALRSKSAQKSQAVTLLCLLATSCWMW